MGLKYLQTNGISFKFLLKYTWKLQIQFSDGKLNCLPPEGRNQARASCTNRQMAQIWNTASMFKDLCTSQFAPVLLLGSLMIVSIFLRAQASSLVIRLLSSNKIGLKAWGCTTGWHNWFENHKTKIHNPPILKLFGFRGHNFFGGNQGVIILVCYWQLLFTAGFFFLRWHLKECFPLVLLLWDISHGGKHGFQRSFYFVWLLHLKCFFLDWKTWIHSWALLNMAVDMCTLRRVQLGYRSLSTSEGRSSLFSFSGHVSNTYVLK